MGGFTKLPHSYSKGPAEFDVLFGRGAACYHHPGNKRYREIVKDRSIDYAFANTFVDKREIASRVIAQLRVESPKLRFLNKNKDTGEWEKVDDKQVKSKIQQALREKISPPWKKRDEVPSWDVSNRDKQTNPSAKDATPKQERKSICMLDLHMRLMYLGDLSPQTPRLEEALRHVQSFLKHVESAVQTAEHIAGIGGANPMTIRTSEDNRGIVGTDRAACNVAVGTSSQEWVPIGGSDRVTSNVAVGRKSKEWVSKSHQKGLLKRKATEITSNSQNTMTIVRI